MRAQRKPQFDPTTGSCYVFTATKLFDACGLLFGDWLPDRCSVDIELLDLTELASRTMTSVVLTISETNASKN